MSEKLGGILVYKTLYYKTNFLYDSYDSYMIFYNYRVSEFKFILYLRVKQLLKYMHK